jgi:hypothetical protein
MYEFVMLVRLATGEPTIALPVHDCKEMQKWLVDARAWQHRAGVPTQQGPLAACGPAEVMLSGLSVSYAKSPMMPALLNVPRSMAD